MLGAIIVLVGAILLISAIFLPWYSIQFSASAGGASVKATENSYPGLPGQNGTVQTTYTCSGVPICPPTSTSSYQDSHLNSTGQVAETGFFLLIVGFVVGLIGAIIGLTSGRNAKRAGTAAVIGLVAMVIAVATFSLFAVALPGAIGNDSPGHSGSGPWSSFFGSGNQTFFGISGASWSWGPAIGWYLTIGAFVVLLVGSIILFTSRKEPPSPAPTVFPQPTGTPTAPPAAPPAP